jgi:ATP diphosphatase
MAEQGPGDETGIARLLAIMARLREPKAGCPWDLEQSFTTIAPHTIEEAYEVVDAIERGDRSALEAELGDLLFQVVYYAQMAAEDGDFDFADVVTGITEKMLRRHPHVFGTAEVPSAEAQTKAWEEHKAAERYTEAWESALGGIVLALPALTRALKLQTRAARVGFDWNGAADVLEKIAEEAAELGREITGHAARARLDDEVGDLLFACVNLARKLEIEPEGALRRANAKFERRFRRVESLLAERGSRAVEATLAEMEACWEAAKAEEREAKEPD